MLEQLVYVSGRWCNSIVRRIGMIDYNERIECGDKHVNMSD